MLFLELRRATLSSEKADVGLEELARALPASFRPVLRPTVGFQADLLGISVGDLVLSEAPQVSAWAVSRPDPVRLAELFSDGTNLWSVVLRDARATRPIGSEVDTDSAPETQLRLTVAYIGPALDRPAIRDFCATANKAFGVELTPFRYSSTRIKELKEEGLAAAVPSTAERLSGAKVLADRATRTIAVAIKSSAGLLVTDLAKQLPPAERERTPAIQDALQRERLVTAELVVICRKNSSQVVRAPSREILEDLARRGLRCGCGRQVTDERVEEALSITDLGRQLLDRSEWLSILVVSELEDLGVPLSQILVGQQAGPDEMDVLADISGDLVFFELKDKEFSLGNAYSFAAKIPIIRPDYSVVITSEVVANDAKDHFRRAELASRSSRRFVIDEDSEPDSIKYVEGIPNLQSGLRDLVSQVFASDATRVLAEVLPFGAIQALSVVTAVAKRAVPQLTMSNGTGASAIETSSRSAAPDMSAKASASPPGEAEPERADQTPV